MIGDSARDTALWVRNVSKRFCRDLKRSLWYGVRDICSEVTGIRRDVTGLRAKEFWALEDVSFDVGFGECFGLIGANGAGKTTLLRMVSGIIKPDAGRIVVHGMTAPLLALGAGFNPVLTGRENIYINMAILGASDQHIRKSYESVVDFAEIENAIDAAVQTYSSGMISRLGFACAIHVAPQIVIVDEVLSVGDMRFRAKCYRKLAELRRAGTSILLVSHNRGDILGICDRVGYLDQGRLKAIGEAPEVLRLYEQDLFGQANVQVPGELRIQKKATGTGAAFERAFLSDERDTPAEALRMGSAGALCFDVATDRPISGVFLRIIVRHISDPEEVVLHLSGDRDNGVLNLPGGRSTIAMEMPTVCLRPGVYTAKVVLLGHTFYIYDAIESFRFRVVADQGDTTTQFFQPHRWCIAGASTERAEQHPEFPTGEPVQLG